MTSQILINGYKQAMSPKAAALNSAQDSILLLIDIQEKLASAMANEAKKTVLQQTEKLLIAATTLDMPVLVTEQYPKGLGSTEEILKQHFNDDVSVIEKTCFSCFQAEKFKQEIESHQKPQVIITGMEAHICVLQTAIDLYHEGYSVFVVEDAIISRTESNKNNAIQRLRQAGVVVTNTESVIFEWLRDAKHEHFRTLSRLIV